MKLTIRNSITALTNGLVDIGGHKLMIHCTGQGSPTIILEAGSGADSTYWVRVQSGGDHSYRVCSYDRANLGESDPVPTPRTYLDMANDLHALMVNAHSMEQVKAAKTLGDLPLVVITRSPDNTAYEGAPILPEETNANLRQIWQAMQRELAGLSSNSTQVIASHAGHDIPGEEPELIIAAIDKLVNEWHAQMTVTSITALSVDQTEATHPPTILRVEERKETYQGHTVFRQEFYYTDSAGDAVIVLTSLVTANPPINWSWPGGFVTASPEEQKQEAMERMTWRCDRQETLAIELQLVDQAFNHSEPLTLTINCPAPQLYISPTLGIGIAAGLIVLVAAWLLVRSLHCHRRGTRLIAPQREAF